VVEQDSIEEIAVCVLAILLCPLGFRDELPEFGLEDLAFSTPEVDLEQIRQAVETWEPRGELLLSQRRDLLDELLTRVQLAVEVRTEE
jgi:phage baseplate assembly protein W